MHNRIEDDVSTNPRQMHVEPRTMHSTDIGRQAGKGKRHSVGKTVRECAITLNSGVEIQHLRRRKEGRKEERHTCYWEEDADSTPVEREFEGVKEERRTCPW